jgi:hypothetical protein
MIFLFIKVPFIFFQIAKNYLLNLTPKVFLPFKNDELYMNMIKQAYEQTKERKKL